MKNIEGLTGFSAFFYRLAEVGFSEVPKFFNGVLDFLTQNFEFYSNKFMIIDFNAKTAIGEWLITIWNSIQGVANQIGDATFGALLRVLGFDTSMPMWLFLISHISLILGFLVIVKFFDLIN